MSASRELYKEEAILYELHRSGVLTEKQYWEYLPKMTAAVEERDAKHSKLAERFRNVEGGLHALAYEYPLAVLLTHPNEEVRKIAKTWSDDLDFLRERMGSSFKEEWLSLPFKEVTALIREELA